MAGSPHRGEIHRRFLQTGIDFITAEILVLLQTGGCVRPVLLSLLVLQAGLHQGLRALRHLNAGEMAGALRGVGQGGAGSVVV